MTKCQKVCKESGQKGLIFLILMSVWHLYFLEGQIVSHVCVKGLNNNVNSFCTVSGQYDGHQLLQHKHLSAATWLLWCSKLYITWMLWALGIRSCKQNMILAYAWRKSIVVIADVCHHVILLLFSNTTFHTFSHTGCKQRTQYKQRGYFQMKIFNVHAFFPPHHARRKVSRTSVLQQHFPFQANKNTNTNRTTL